MIEAVFISDLHLNPEEPAITKRFNQFVDWALINTRSIYILGDFFHVWPGDDAIDEWSMGIARRLAQLAQQGIAVYFMHGNRDFLLGETFAQAAKFTILNEPTIISLGNQKILLAHGDRYCTKDRGHQLLRRFTRNRWFPKVFLKLPFNIRHRLVNQVRKTSQNNRNKSEQQLTIVHPVMLHHVQQLTADAVIHGHIHQPEIKKHVFHGKTITQYVLSDWDDNPKIMCYDNANRFYFDLLVENEHA